MPHASTSAGVQATPSDQASPSCRVASDDREACRLFIVPVVIISVIMSVGVGYLLGRLASPSVPARALSTPMADMRDHQESHAYLQSLLGAHILQAYKTMELKQGAMEQRMATMEAESSRVRAAVQALMGHQAMPSTPVEAVTPVQPPSPE